MGTTQQLGSAAEEHACQHLQKQGLKLLERNYRCRVGEIDLIMQDKVMLVFVEVRSRKKNDFGSSVESITYAKQRKLIKAAQYYLQQKKLHENIACRFDVVAITSASQERAATLEWIKNAFTSD